MSRASWWRQLSSCYEKGYLAHGAGVPSDKNPYRTGYPEWSEPRRQRPAAAAGLVGPRLGPSFQRLTPGRLQWLVGLP